MRKAAKVALIVLALLVAASAQVNIIAWNPVSTNLGTVLPYIDGVAVPITWAPTDGTSCSGSPVICTPSFFLFEL